MSTPQVTVIVPPELADGYRLAGLHAEQADTADAAGAALKALTTRDDPPGVVAVYSPYLRELGGRWERRVTQPDRVLVVALPEGQAPGGPPRTGESLRDLLARAVGYEFTFDPMEGTR
jgi:vacuolar-type H+-ATPase subunit F/Vma7